MNIFFTKQENFILEKINQKVDYIKSNIVSDILPAHIDGVELDRAVTHASEQILQKTFSKVRIIVFLLADF